MEMMVPCPNGVTLCDGLLTDPTVGYVSTLNVTPVWCFIPDSEDNDLEVTAEGIEEHAPSLPLPLHQPPHWMDCLPVQHALLHRLHGPDRVPRGSLRCPQLHRVPHLPKRGRGWMLGLVHQLYVLLTLFLLSESVGSLHRIKGSVLYGVFAVWPRNGIHRALPECLLHPGHVHLVWRDVQHPVHSTLYPHRCVSP